MANPNDTQVGGTHYKDNAYQSWDFIRANLDGRFLEGNISKYLTRWRFKGGPHDLLKALHYLEKLIDTNGDPMMDKNDGLRVVDLIDIENFCEANSVGNAERRVITILAGWTSVAELNVARTILEKLINEVSK